MTDRIDGLLKNFRPAFYKSDGFLGEIIMKDIHKKRAAAALALILLCGCGAKTEAPAQTAAVTSEASDTTIQQITEEVTSSQADEETQATDEASGTDAAEYLSEDIDQTTGYKYAYKEKLTELLGEIRDEEEESLAMAMFSVYDAGGDETPELFVSRAEYRTALVDVYTCIDDEAVYVGELGSYGTVDYMTEKKAFDNCFGNMGSIISVYVDFDGEKLNNGICIESYEDYNYEDEENETIIQKFYINGEETTEEEYYKANDENFGGPYVILGRDFYLNEYGISAVFEEHGEDKAIDEMVLSCPEDYNRPVSMATEDITGDGGRDLVFFNGHQYALYYYDESMKFVGYSPTYGYEPYKTFDISGLDFDTEYIPDEYILTYNTETHEVVCRVVSQNERIYVSTIENGVLVPQTIYTTIKLKDDSFVYAINDRQVDKEEFDSNVQKYFSDGFKTVQFDALAVG